MNPRDLKRRLRIEFAGEEAVDDGGVIKEWFSLLTKQLFDLNYGMFTLNNGWFWFRPQSDNFLDFKLIGMLIGLAIYNSVLLDLKFPMVLYKKIMNRNITFDDLGELFPSYHDGFKKILAYQGDDFEDTFDLNFQLFTQSYGETIAIDLKQNGQKMQVTLENRQGLL